jgi:hypothetical protein
MVPKKIGADVYFLSYNGLKYPSIFYTKPSQVGNRDKKIMEMWKFKLKILFCLGSDYLKDSCQSLTKMDLLKTIYDWMLCETMTLMEPYKIKVPIGCQIRQILGHKKTRSFISLLLQF